MTSRSRSWFLAGFVTLAVHGCADEEGGGGAETTFDAAATVADSSVAPGLDASAWPGTDGSVFPPSGDSSVTPTGDGGVTGDGGGSVVDPNMPALPKGKDYSGWTWVDVPGSVCRDGSGAGYYYRLGKSKSLLIYLNGGGACADPFFCGLNPVNVNQDLPIELLIGGAPNLLLGPNASRQIAPEEGMFKRAEPKNPVADWDMIYVPYCTGDIHAGARRDVTVPGVSGKQQFAGYTNFGLFLESFGPSFAGADRALLTGSSAGGFGTLMNFDRTQEYFKKWEIELMGISDSGIPMRNQYMAKCLQKRWREYWGLNDILPKDCKGCFEADGGSMTEGLGAYLFKEKYKDRMVGGFISTANDQIIRSFFAPGMSSTSGAPDDCTLDPTFNTVFSSILLGQYTGEKYKAGIKDVIDNVTGADKIGYYVMTGEIHMHLWRPHFYEKNGNTQSIAEWMKDILEKKPTKQGML